MVASLCGFLRKWGSFPLFVLLPPLMATDWRGEAFSFSFLLYCGDQLSHYRLMTFVGANPFVESKQFVCCSVESLYSLLTCLCQCQGPWGEQPDVQRVTQIPCSQRTKHRVKENNPTQSCSASTKTRTEGSGGALQQLFDMLTRPCCFGLCQRGRFGPSLASESNGKAAAEGKFVSACWI